MKLKMKRSILTTFRKIKINTQNRKILAASLILILLILSLGMIQGTLGSFARGSAMLDSALAAKFDVIITSPESFRPEGDERIFSYHFISREDIRALSFEVYNNGEANVICTPHISEGVIYRVFILGVETSEFLVRAKETVRFNLLIGPEGLDTNIKDAELFVDIRQTEGG